MVVCGGGSGSGVGRVDGALVGISRTGVEDGDGWDVEVGVIVGLKSAAGAAAGTGGRKMTAMNAKGMASKLHLRRGGKFIEHIPNL